MVKKQIKIIENSIRKKEWMRIEVYLRIGRIINSDDDCTKWWWWWENNFKKQNINELKKIEKWWSSLLNGWLFWTGKKKYVSNSGIILERNSCELKNKIFEKKTKIVWPFLKHNERNEFVWFVSLLSTKLIDWNYQFLFLISFFFCFVCILSTGKKQSNNVTKLKAEKDLQYEKMAC